MSTNVRVWGSVIAAIALVGCLAPAAQAEIIADWQFEGATTWLDDSNDSSDGHLNLVNNSGGVTWDSATGSAVFSGGKGLYTGTSLDLTAYKDIRVSWSQKTVGVAGGQYLFEQSGNIGYSTGAFNVYTTNVGTVAQITQLGATNGNGTLSLDTCARTNPATPEWEYYTVEFHAGTAAAASDAIILSRNGILGTDYLTPGAPSTFKNDWLYIGARSAKANSVSFTGSIGYLKIESVPEPTTVVMLATGLFGLLCYAWRKRK